MTNPNARPMEIQIADSIAASLMLITCAVRCTSSRSTISMATIATISAAHTHSGVSKLTKFSPDSLSAARRLDVRAAITVTRPSG